MVSNRHNCLPVSFSNLTFHRKLSTILIVAAISSATSQNVLECRYHFNFFGEYGCELSQIEVLDPNSSVVIGGLHLEGLTANDVRSVEVINSTTPFMIQEIFTTFPNLIELDYVSAGLQSINLPTTSRIEFLQLVSNNIRSIANNTFINHPQLLYLRLSHNVIEEIAENAFNGLASLTNLVLTDNRIRELTPRTFEPLVSMTYLDLENNNLSRVGDIFSTNVNLYSIFLEYNQIQAISPSFVTRERHELLSFINLYSNVCVQRSFGLFSPEGWTTMNGALTDCFSNFGVPSDNNTIQCQFMMNVYNEYICVLENIEVLDELATVTITGEHLEGRTNDDVEVVEVRNSRTPFMIQEIFTTFPNIDELGYFNSGLQSIRFSRETRLSSVLLNLNNINRIEDNTFANQPQLRYLRLSQNNIRELGEDAFVGLGNLYSLPMINNQISEILPRTFEPLASVTYLDLERNNLTRVGDVFSAMPAVSSIYLEFNQINEISPNFVNRGNNARLTYINLSGNVCIQRFFSINSDQTFGPMNRELRRCFINFLGPQEEIEIECVFYVNFYGEYVCELSGIEVVNEFDTILVGGEHLEGRTNADVEVVEIYDSNTPFIIPEIAETFVNANEWVIAAVGLQSIFIPFSPELRWITIYLNNITHLEERAFAANPQIIYLDLWRNEIQNISPDAFVGLVNLQALALIDNNIREIHPRTFNPLPSVSYLDLEGNSLTRVGEILSNNRNLYSLFLEYNQIEAISPRLLTHLRGGRFSLVSFLGNACIDGAFFVGGDQAWIETNNALQPCFRAYLNEPEGAVRRVVFEFTGNLELFDRNGNILASL